MYFRIFHKNVNKLKKAFILFKINGMFDEKMEGMLKCVENQPVDLFLKI